MRKCITIILLALGLIFCISMPASAVSFNMGGDESSESDTESISSDTGESDENYSVSTLSTANIVDSGTCGANLTWTLYDDGLFEITGTGAMKDYYTNIPSPWYQYKENITDVRFSDGVTSIGGCAFYQCTELTGNITIPDSVTYIGGFAFANCTGLTGIGGNLSIPDSIKYIGDSAFANCTGLNGKLSIPRGSIRIYRNPFRGCNFDNTVVTSDGYTYIDGCLLEIPSDVEQLKVADGTWLMSEWLCFNKNINSVDIPESVYNIGYQCFYGCTELEKVIIRGDKLYTDGELFRDCKKLTTAGPIGSGCNIEYGWTDEIPDNAFRFADYLEDIKFPDTITRIGTHAFFFCDRLSKRIEIPYGVILIEQAAFDRSAITGVTIPDSVQRIGTYAFQGCDGLTRVTIPDSVTYLSGHSLNGCDNLECVDVGNGIEYIDGDTFSSCPNLSIVKIGSSVRGLGTTYNNDISGHYMGGNMPFYNCGNVYIEVSSDNEYLSSIDGVLFNKAQTTLMCYAKDKSEPEYTIPYGVTSIQYDAFYYCTNLTYVSIPETVTSIGSLAFRHCTGLTNITIPKSVKNISTDIFYYCTGLLNINVDKSEGAISGAPWYATNTTVTWLRELKTEGLQDQTYTGSAIKPITLYEVRKDDASIKDPLQSSLYTITYTNNKNVGTASVKATLKSNSSVILDDTFEILPKNCSSLNISSIPNKTYTGSEIKPEPTVTDPDI